MIPLRVAVAVAVVGAGPVGRALARAWQQSGDTVVLAVRNPADSRHDVYRADYDLVPLAELPAADVTLLAVPGAALPELLATTPRTLEGRLVIDATNQVGPGPMHQLPLLAARLRDSVVCRAFTTVGWENFTGSVAGSRPDLLWSGPATGTPHDTVAELISHTGMRPVWVGEGEAGAAILDHATRIWFGLAMGGGLGRRLAIQILSTDRTAQ